MRKRGLLVLALIPVLLLAACTNEGEKLANEETENTAQMESLQEPKYYFVASEGGSIRKFDAKNNALIDTMQAEGLVHSLRVSPDGQWLAATLSDENVQHAGNHLQGSVLFYNTENGELMKQVSVGAHPAYVVFTNNGKYALVTNSEDDNVSIIETDSYQILGSIPTGSKPNGIQVSKDDMFAYVANMGDNTVSVLDLTNLREEKKMKVGQRPVMTGLTSDGKTLIVTLFGENGLAIIDLTTNELQKIPVGKGPVELWVQPDDRYVFVTNQGTQQSPSNTVSKVDLKTRRTSVTIQTGEGSHGLTGGDNGKVYVTNMFENTVSIVDTTKNRVVRTMKAAPMPGGIGIH